MSFLANLCGGGFKTKCCEKELESKGSKTLENFTAKVPTVIYFGKGEVKKSLGKALKENGASNILLAYGGGSIKKRGLYQEVVQILKDSKLKFIDFGGITPNPRVSKVREGIEIIRKEKIDFILSVGGGSCIDCCKAIARGVYSKVDIWEHFEAQRKSIQDKSVKPIKVEKAVPLGTILTLAATGSEMNAGCVVNNEETEEKLFCFDALTKPKFSILDPELTYTVSEYQTKAGCMDIFSHIQEGYFCTNSPYLTDRIAEGLMKTILHYLPIALKEPNNYEARSNIMWCGTMALNGFSTYGRKFDNVGYPVHKLEHSVSAVFPDFTHGMGLAIIQLAWMKKIISCGENKEKAIDKLCLFGKNVMGLNLCGINEKNAKKAIEALEEYQKEHKIPTKMSEVLKDYDEKKAIECCDLYNKHWDSKNVGFEKFSKTDILEIYKDCI